MGMATQQHTPEGRGFDTSLIYFEHMNYYWDQQICPTGTSCDMQTESYIRDFWDTGAPAAPNPNDTYIEYLFQQRIMDVVANHDMADGPLYLQYTPHVAHWPLQVPEEWYDRVTWVQDDENACGDDIPKVWPGSNRSVISCRRQYEAMVLLVDEIVGNLTDAIKAKGWWNDTLMIFTADNGGSISPSENAASNYPLRGGKYGPFEGGTRAAAFVSGGFLPPLVQGTQLESVMHVTGKAHNTYMCACSPGILYACRLVCNTMWVSGCVTFRYTCKHKHTSTTTRR
jgi:arylsulfatase B